MVWGGGEGEGGFRAYSTGTEGAESLCAFFRLLVEGVG